MNRAMHLAPMLWIWSCLISQADFGVHHHLSVSLDPGAQTIDVTDTITLPADRVERRMHMLLHRNLDVVSCSLPVTAVDAAAKPEDFRLDQNTTLPAAVPTKHWLVQTAEPEGDDLTFEITYRGRIHHEVVQLAQGYARGFSETPGIIDARGVYLAGASAWVPWFRDTLITFDLTVTMPKDWHAVSQGARTENTVDGNQRRVTWSSPEPMEEVYLVAAPFHVYERPTGAIDTMAYLRAPDDGLAAKYLETTAQYLKMYQDLIGPFPFKKFALVENFWETGYGMPSFTLLGEKIIRFPFILHSSYPHELLHNYWGNSVYVDSRSGNWCEGLTVFMADQLIKEQRGQGADHRRAALQRFTDYVRPDNDFPLTQFGSRTDAASEAIGYGKSQMMFHMLRSELGTDTWIESIQRFYRDFKFKRASFSDLRTCFESVSGRDLAWFFDQWTTRVGAPEFRLEQAATVPKGEGSELTFSIRQIQAEDPFRVGLPIAVWTEDSVFMRTVSVSRRLHHFTLQLPVPPRRISLDPEFDVFRRLDHHEIPPSLSKIFGADRVVIVVPSEADVALLKGYEDLAAAWSQDETREISVVREADLETFPTDGSVWIMGRQNRFSDILADGLKPYGAILRDDALTVGPTTVDLETHSLILAVRHPLDPNAVAVWLTLAEPKAWPGLSRKLPHYGKYSALAFEGEEPTNTFKHQWPVVDSPLVVDFARSASPSAEHAWASLPAREPLAEMGPVFSEERLMQHVTFLASQGLNGRGWGSPGLDQAGQYIAAAFETAGLKPMGDVEGETRSYFQTWQEIGGPEKKETVLRNVVGMIEGHHPDRKHEAVVICAHYDHLGLGWPDVREGNAGKIHPGADDNASGVAAMLELAHVLAKTLKPDRTLVFAAFSGEESGLRGSRHFVKTIQDSGSLKIASAINLDTVGRLGDGELMVLSGQSAREWKFIFMGCSYVTGVPTVMVTQDLDASDQKSFIAAGIPAVQLFSGPHDDYHRPTDTPDKVDGAGLIKVATVTKEAIDHLVSREDPLTFAGPQESPQAAPTSGPPRRVSTGTMPDFAFSGSGVRIASIAPGSPGEKAGLQIGDVIVKVDATPVTDLRGYAETLRNYQTGDTVSFSVLRDGKERVVSLTFTAR